MKLHKRRLRNAALVFAALALIAFAAVYGTLMAIEDRFIYYPDAVVWETPDRYGLRHEEVFIDTSDGGQVHGWFLHPRTEDEPLAYLLFSHGNAGNITSRLPIADELCARGMAVLMYDYRGYGKSPGVPSEKGLYEDGDAALAELVRRAGDPAKVVIYGRSLGGAVSWELATRHPEVAGVITDCSFTSLPDMAARAFPLPFIGAFCLTRMDNRRKVARAEIPKLLLHGADDEIIPLQMGVELSEAAREPVELVMLPGAGHNDTWAVDPDLYFGSIERFVRANVPE